MDRRSTGGAISSADNTPQAPKRQVRRRNFVSLPAYAILAQDAQHAGLSAQAGTLPSSTASMAHQPTMNDASRSVNRAALGVLAILLLSTSLACSLGQMLVGEPTPTPTLVPAIVPPTWTPSPVGQLSPGQIATLTVIAGISFPRSRRRRPRSSHRHPRPHLRLPRRRLTRRRRCQRLTSWLLRRKSICEAAQA